ncbi:heme exporter protein CcmB [soil metagenome]
MFALTTVVTIALAFFNKNPNQGQFRDLAAALLWIALTFTSLLGLPRTFLAEEEAGTMDLLRLLARPHAVFWGKTLYNLVQSTFLGGFVTVMFLALVGVRVEFPLLFAVGMLGGSVALSSTVTLCGAIAAPAANRSAVAAAIAVPLVLPLEQALVAATRASFGAGVLSLGWTSAYGSLGFATLALALGPVLFAAVWKP